MKIYILSLLLITACRAYSQESSANPRFDEYYTVREAQNFSQNLSLNPIEAAKDLWVSAESLQDLKKLVYSLLDFEYHEDSYGDVDEPYNRQKHFGSWVDDSRDDNCYSTRAKVLIRDSAEEVTFSRNGCTVATGYWADPYAGDSYTDAKDIQVDHFVPLKNAYISGAYKWSPRERCLYANFLGNNFHLLPVYGKENNKKSDKTPEGYMPRNSSYSCQYLAQWLKIKLIWSLGLTPPEKEKILALIQENDCDISQMSFSAQELTEQRQFMNENMDLCVPEDSMQKN